MCGFNPQAGSGPEAELLFYFQTNLTLMINYINPDGIAPAKAEGIKTVAALVQAQDDQNQGLRNPLSQTGRTVNLFIVGTGNVGTAFVKQLHLQAAFFAREFQTDFRIIGLANTRKMYINRCGIRSHDWKEILMSSARDSNISRFIDEMVSMNLPETIFIDNTASEDISKFYKRILSARISVVTCNKIAASSAYSVYSELKKIAVTKDVHFRFESNVGAGLPIIQTINNLVRTGDQVHCIEAVVSGSLNFIFNNFCDGMKFSDAVLKAMRAGYTEPNPLIDLRGIDVSRKLLILVREAGIRLEESEIEINDLLPLPLPEKYDPNLFAGLLRKFDPEFEKIRKNIAKFNRKIRVIASYNNGKAEIALREVDSTHPFFNLEGNDNVVSILTSRYPSRPMIIKGAGAGAEVTASGIFSDILSIVNR